MFEGVMGVLHLIFFVCFGVGVGFVVISFIIGELGPGDGFENGLFFLKPSILASFLVVFGGAGLIAESRTIGIVAIGVAALCAFAVTFVIYRFVIIPLHRAQSTSVVEKQSLIGHDAIVIERISQGQYGKISFSIHGNRHSAPAKSEDGNEILRNQAVQITYIDKNTYYVKRKDV